MKNGLFHRRILIAAAALILPAMAMARSLPVDGYAALVNNRVITVGEILAIVQPIRAQLAETYDGKELEKKMSEAYQESLDALIERALILEEFTAMGGNIPDRAVDDQINVMINERFKNDRTAFLEALAEDRMTLDDWREETKNRLVVNLMRRREVMDRVIITPRAVRDLYESRSAQYQVPEQILLSMIVLHKGTSPDDQAVKKKEAARIREKLVAGGDFAETAKSSSEGYKAAEGGSQGWMDPKTLRKELAAAVATLESGRISDVIETDDDLYILKVEAKKNASITPFDDVRTQIEDELRKAEELRMYNAWIERLKRKFYVKILLEEEDALNIE
jgi:peptidyl-prolyl cis-trans isomerase SurA